MYSINRLILKWARRLDQSNTLRRVWIVLINFGIFASSGLIAFLLRFEFHIDRTDLRYLEVAAIIWIAIKLVTFHVAGLNRGWWRFVSVHDLGRLAAANLAASGLSAIIIWLSLPGFPRSVYIIDLLICFLATAGIRVFVRLIMETGIQARQTDAKRVVIYGAGMAGQALLREIRSNPQLAYSVCGFLDDDLRKRGISIQGVRVLGTANDLARAAAAQAIDEVLVAIPSASGSQMAAILERCHQAGTACKTIPGLGDLVEDNGLATQIRDVAVEDLLGRNPVHLEEGRIRERVEGRVVLITGAAGSIGSELCRQLARFRPSRIVGVEMAESALFELDREMRQTFPDTAFVPVIGSVQNRTRLDEILGKYSPFIVYHAAAYKHVPLMEANVFEAIENNVFGTYNVALAAAEHGVQDFVMISSDKAVRPTNIMGVTKRLAELLLMGLQNGRTKYVAVRFGNVLGSNGSVIPIFKKQIAAGGPVTVTHPEMRRFFMTIPEACQLVLQAAAIAAAGQICVLDMGEPVKIVDLARNLILLSGLKPDVDIKIEFTGIRPGEKLYEELSTMLDDTVPTAHEKIRIYVGKGQPEGDPAVWLDSLKEICQTRDSAQLLVALKDIVLDYSPSADLLKRVLALQHSRAVAVAG